MRISRMALLLIALASCARESAEPNLLSGEPSFAAIPRHHTSSNAPGTRQSALRQGASDDGDQEFYLAVHRDALEERWFLSAYLKQFFPGAVSYGAARSLGTRVVRFRLQNDKLYVFTADDLKKTSDTFDPDVIVEAYPLVEDKEIFGRLPNKDKYVLIDPAAGLNRFDVVGENYGAYGQRFMVELAYLQRFRRIADGITYEQVFTGYGETADPGSWQYGEDNQFRASGTLGIGLRRYQEGPGYTPTELPEQELYFRGDPKIVPNAGTTTQVAAKWNIRPGMAPIRWMISNQFAQVQQNPKYQDYDIVGAVRAGIEGWNQAFGFRALEAVVATADDSFADDDVNYLIYDADPSYGAAFANWRTNPNTGEIRGASVYFNGLWLTGADEYFVNDPMPEPPELSWQSLPEQRLCTYWAPPFRKNASERLFADLDVGTSELTKKQKVERYVTHVILHEIGHTLGLRHNFKGSLLPPSSSVMDYLDDEASIALSTVGSYDVEAIKYLYGLQSTTPKDPFCTDEHTRIDPECNRFDATTKPLEDYYAKNYQTFLEDYLQGQSPSAPNNSLNGVLQFVRASRSPQVRAQALELAIGAVRVGKVSAPLVQTFPGYAAAADAMARRILRRLYLDPPESRGAFFRDPPVSDVALGADLLAELRGNLLNSDGLRSYETRRSCVDILKKLQSADALAVLMEAEAALEPLLPSLAGQEAVLAQDLLSRVSDALSPYFLQ